MGFSLFIFALFETDQSKIAQWGIEVQMERTKGLLLKSECTTQDHFGLRILVTL
jgi:hypothetical protein